MNEKENLEKGDDEYVIFSLEDDPEVLDFLGKIISTDYARKFLKLTSEEEMNLKAIAKKITNMENPRIPNAISWKKRLEKVGLLVCREKQQRKNGHILKYYKGKKITLIVKDKSLAEAIKSNEDFNTSLKRILKMSGIVCVIITTIFLTENSSSVIGMPNFNNDYVFPINWFILFFGITFGIASCISLLLLKKKKAN